MLSSFPIRFLICNGFITLLAAGLLLIKYLLKNHVSRRGQYRLGFLVLLLLSLPILPFRLSGPPGILSFLQAFGELARGKDAKILVSSDAVSMEPGVISDFSISVKTGLPPLWGFLLIAVWLLGVFFFSLLFIRRQTTFRRIMRSSLLAQNEKVWDVYRQCKKELNIKRKIPIYSTAYLNSPVIAGFCRPAVYIPLHLISDFEPVRLRYIFLHELEHYKQKDSIIQLLMNLFGIIYWYHPLIRHILKEMRNECEISCDCGVLYHLKEEEYKAYGATLLDFAEKASRFTAAFAIGGNKKQIYRRIANIASYRRESALFRIRGIAVFLLTGILLLSCAPALSLRAGLEDRFHYAKKASYVNSSPYFDEYEGSFVLYDLQADACRIYGGDSAVKRVSPDSTYKLYSALFALEENIITPEDTFASWDEKKYPIPAWNQDQTLFSAMQNSVNWYFQELDRRIGLPALQRLLKKVRYGNQDLTGGLGTCWLESSLKISPVEQVELLRRFYCNDFNFSQRNVEAVKSSLLIASDLGGALYGKTGTGMIDGRAVNGWFIGFVEKPENTFFFAANIQKDDDADGKTAAEIALRILKDQGIYL